MINVMKYGIIVCPKCKKSKVVILFNKTTKCTRCGKNLNLKKIPILYKSDSGNKVREYIGILNRKLDKT